MVVKTATVTSVFQSLSGSVLSVTTASSTTYSVDATKARITYKGSRKGDVTILQVGDGLSVYGKAVSGSTSVTASLVRDVSRIYTATSSPQQ